VWQLPIIRHLLQTSLPQDLHLPISSLLPHLQTLFRLISALLGVDLSGMVSCRSEITSSLVDNLPRGLFCVTGSSPKDILSCGCADLCLRIFSFIVILSCFFIKSPISFFFCPILILPSRASHPVGRHSCVTTYTHWQSLAEVLGHERATNHSTDRLACHRSNDETNCPANYRF